MRLTHTGLKGLLERPGRHADGKGLFFRTLGGGRGYWVYRYRFDGKEREYSIGPYPAVKLIDARTEHLALAKRVKVDKIDVLQERLSAKAAKAEAALPVSTKPTFGKMADQYLERQERRGLLGKNPKHRAQWRSTLSNLPASFRDLPVDQIGPKQVFEALDPIWDKTPETASRLRGRIAAVLDFAREPEDTHPNPAAWSGWLRTKLGSPTKLGKIDRKTGKRVPRGHHAAMPYADVPAFMAKLKAAPGVASKALMFVILTAARSSEAFDLKWDANEIDFEAARWTIPADRMKMKEEHRVPLSGAAVEILRGQLEARGKNPHVFPSPLPKQPLSDMALAMTIRRLGAAEFTVHGFRSSFRDWCTEIAKADFATAEKCLAHEVGNKSSQAYDRSDRYDLRVPLMTRWAVHCFPTESKVESLEEGRKRHRKATA
jgi:integrase